MSTQEDKPIDLFEKVDFEAWNGPDWDLFRKLHTDDVIVDMFGDHTDGIDAHVDACQAYQNSTPAFKVLDILSGCPTVIGHASSRSPRVAYIS